MRKPRLGWMAMPALAAILFLHLADRASGGVPENFGAWQGSPAKAIADADLAAAAGENAAVIREYGFVAGERREYRRGGQTLTATLWQLKDATGSLGLFTFLNAPAMKAEKLGEDIVSTGILGGDEALLLLRGAYLLEARGAAVPYSELPALTAEIPVTDELFAMLPTLPSYFPEEGLVPQSRKFVLGPLALGRVLREIPVAKLGWESGTEAAAAQYRFGAQTATMLLMLYPTPQLAAKKFSGFLELPEVSGGPGLPSVLIQRKGSLVGLVIGAPSTATATLLLDHVNYETTLMWNEYVPPEGQGVADMVLAVFSLAGAVLFFAFVAGIAFGGVRVFVKKYIPFPVFDRPAEMEIIKLDLEEK